MDWEHVERRDIQPAVHDRILDSRIDPDERRVVHRGDATQDRPVVFDYLNGKVDSPTILVFVFALLCNCYVDSDGSLEVRIIGTSYIQVPAIFVVTEAYRIADEEPSVFADVANAFQLRQNFGFIGLFDLL